MCHVTIMAGGTPVLGALHTSGHNAWPVIAVALCVLQLLRVLLWLLYCYH
jgi:hypothetical protein